MKNFFIILLTVMLFAASCRKTDEYLPLSPQEDAVYHQTVPYSITVSITPIADNIDGVEWKSTFYEGDFIQISNSLLLTEPAILTSNDCIGKDKATFSGELKVKLGKTLEPGSSTLTAVLKNADTSLHLYSDGRPFMDVKAVEANTEALDRCCYWTCEDFAYNSNAASIDLVQKTVFVNFQMPFGGVKFSVSSDNAFSSDVDVDSEKLYVVPYGMVLKSDMLNLEKKLDEDGVCVYKIDFPAPPDCIPGIFTVADGKQVYFSKGNLQNYNSIWQLAPHQYDVPQSYNNNDLSAQFSWYEDDWYRGFFGRNGLEDDFKCVLGPQWSLLSFKEWNYLFYRRPNAADKCGVAHVAGIEGVILLPDDWKLTDGFALSSNYSEEEWTQMENAGAVFLPMDGDYSYYYTDYTTKFSYWTSSAASYDCISLALESGYVGLSTKEQNHGAVRLVYDKGVFTYIYSDPSINPTSDIDRCIVVDKEECDYVDFYLCTHGFIEGQKYKLSMKVKADYEEEFNDDLLIGYTPVSSSTGSTTPSYYYPETGEVSDCLSFSSEWKTVELTGEFDSEGWVIGFELYHSNKYYFDDIQLTIDDTETIINGDCSSDDMRSFAVVDDFQELIPVTFIDKESIINIEPGAVIYEMDFTTVDVFSDDLYSDYAVPYDFDPENGLIINDDDRYRVAEGVPALEGKKYSVIVEIRGEEEGELNATMHWGMIYKSINTTVEFGTEWETREFFFDKPVEGGNCFINFENFFSDQTVYIRNIKVVYQGK